MEFNLEERTFQFALHVRIFCKKIIRFPELWEDIKQLQRSSGSVGANYIESWENLGIADEKMKIKTGRKESKESVYWLRLLILEDEFLRAERNKLSQEGTELTKIFSAILKKLNEKKEGVKK